MTPEGLLKKDVTEFLNASGLTWFKMQSGITKVRGGFMHHCPVGTPDILIFQGSVPYWCELKGKGQKTAKDRAAKQAAFREKVLAMGHHHKQCMSLDDVVSLLKGE